MCDVMAVGVVLSPDAIIPIKRGVGINVWQSFTYSKFELFRS